MIPEEKLCTKCKQIKNKSEFYTKKDKGYIYLKTYCKPCSNEQSKKYKKNICECGQEKDKRSKSCQECTESKKYFTLGDAVKAYSKYAKSASYTIVRARASYANKETKCRKCGYDKHVEVCHIKSISSFPLETSIDVINDPSNITVLCPNCHWELDNLFTN